jgi:hypothetical protein
MVVHAYNPSNKEAGRSLELGVGGQPGLYRENLSQRKK